ncbi:hypothetical protein FBEOM_3162 [Fusarium beomiforme]|uniref:Uncharacterized protein n=1 Tax=Fusarium beomiforme TaxID=44412 RepID=A0A9P5AQ38_9HYPO|nr:hypothetical protein FBEOM_3162 [Fusarium beomiforme]
MLFNSLRRSIAPLLLWILGLAAAELLATTVLWDPEQGTSRSIDEKTMVECGGHISQCGVMEDIKIVRLPVSTVYVTQNFTTTTEKVLPTQTVIVKSVKVVTVNHETQGHCRETMTVPDLKPAIITVNVTVEHVKEIVPLTTQISVETHIVTAPSIAQCFINNPHPSLHPAASSQVPPPVALSSQELPALFASGEPEKGDIVEDIRHERVYEQVGEVPLSEEPENISQDGSLLFNLASFILPALYGTLSKLWVASIDSSMVVLTDAYTYMNTASEAVTWEAPSVDAYSHRFSICYRAALSIVFLGAASSFANSFVPEEVRDASLTCVRIASFTVFSGPLETAVATAARALDKPDIPLAISTVKLAVNIILDFLIISRFHLGSFTPTVNMQGAI